MHDAGVEMTDDAAGREIDDRDDVVLLQRHDRLVSRIDVEKLRLRIAPAVAAEPRQLYPRRDPATRRTGQLDDG